MCVCVCVYFATLWTTLLPCTYFYVDRVEEALLLTMIIHSDCTLSLKVLFVVVVAVISPSVVPNVTVCPAVTS